MTAVITNYQILNAVITSAGTGEIMKLIGEPENIEIVTEILTDHPTFFMFHDGMVTERSSYIITGKLLGASYFCVVICADDQN